ncbi:multiheme c-type cytochrome [Bacteroidota bacterium]
MKRFLLYLIVPMAIILISSAGFYGYWNSADPVKTCASCHEITPSVSTWQHSAHREVKCFDCHGTALSNGLHSLKEKTNMVFTHISEEKQNDEIRMTEAQVLEVEQRCAGCHQDEYGKWKTGGHGTNYRNIFLNQVHNSEERLYWDCLRCHGMFFEGNIYDLVTPISTIGPWSLLDPDKELHPVIPCQTCHKIHTENSPYKSGIQAPDRNPSYGLYVRAEKFHLRGDHLPVPEMYHGDQQIKVSDDPVQALCVQCHAPGAFHFAGTSDDRTPTGVHEGLSCSSCHEPHSNNPKNSCISCHPAISNCGLDVTKMNTTHFYANSPNNIHFVACTDCHEDLLKD